MSNEKVHNITKVIPWSKIVENRRLRWFGHLVRLPDCAPAKLALKVAEHQCPMPRGQRRTIWLDVIKNNSWHTAWTTSKQSLMHRTESIGRPFATKPDLPGKKFPFFWKCKSEERSQQMMMMIIPYHSLNETFRKDQAIIKHIPEKW